MAGKVIVTIETAVVACVPHRYVGTRAHEQLIFVHGHNPNQLTTWVITILFL